MATRKFYDSDEYHEKTRQLEEILFSQATRLTLPADEFNIQGKADEPQEFISKREMSLFAPLADFDCRTIKLVNYGRPAISLAYFTKHKYYVDKKLHPDQIRAILFQQIQDARASYNSEDVAEELKETLLQQIDHYQDVYNHMERYQFALSNYYRFYRYSYVSFRYVQHGLIKSANSHLIKHTIDKDSGEILIERTNIIFVDEIALVKQATYANKEVVDFLNTFTDVIPLGKVDFYFKK